MDWKTNDNLPCFDVFSMWAYGDWSQTTLEEEMG